MNQKQKRIFIMAFTATLLLSILAMSGLFNQGVKDGYGGGFPVFFASGTQKHTQGDVALKVNKKTYSLNAPILVQFHYGQDFNDTLEEGFLDNTLISVFVIENIGSIERSGSFDDENKMFLHEILFPGQEIIDEQYTYKKGFFWFSKRSYKAGFTLNIDFSTIPYDKGALVIAFSQTILEESEGELMTTHDISYVYFTKSNGKIRFS